MKFITGRSRSGLASHTGWLLVSQTLGIALQAVTWILVARSLGVSEYGRLAAVVALVAMTSPVVALGFEGIVARRASRDAGALEHALGQAFCMNLIGGGLAVLILVAVCSSLLPRALPAYVIATICLSELVIARISGLIVLAFQITDRYAALFFCSITSQLLRLGAALALTRIADADAGDWAGLTVLVTALGAMLAFGVMRRCSIRLRPVATGLRAGLAEGGFFALSGASRMACTQADKAILAHQTSDAVIGVYAAASRLADAALQPILALAQASYPRFFRAGATGVHSSRQLALRLLPFSFVYGALAGGALLVAAPVIGRWLGPGFDELGVIVLWLAPLPLLRGLQYQAGGALTGAGRQRLRAKMQAAMAVFNVALNLLLVPLYSWKGAAGVALATDLVFAIALWCMLVFAVDPVGVDPSGNERD